MNDSSKSRPLPGGDLCQKLFEASAEGIAIADIDSRALIRANPAFCLMFGHDEETILKQGMPWLHPPEALPVIMAAFAAQASGGTRWDADVPCLRKDGSVFYADIHSSLTEIDGRTCIIGMFHDTTLRRQAEELRAHDRRLGFLLNATPAVIYTYRAKGDFGTTFLSANVISTMGYRPEEFMADRGFWQAHVHPGDAARIPAHMEELFAHGKHSYEYRFLHKDGTWRWMLDESRLLRDDQGQPLEIAGYWLDISARKLAEAELGRMHLEALERGRRLEETAKDLAIQKAAAETANQAKSAFLSNMTHEMNTPLNSIIGFSEILADQTFGALNDKQKKYADNIHDSGRQLLAIINNLFDLTRLDSSPDAVSSSVFSLEEVLRSVVRLSEAPAAAGGLRLSAEAPPACLLESDEKLLTQALLLLLSNAIKFTPSGGKAGIRARQASAGIEISVWDTGIGIAAEDMGKLFQPLLQLERFETKKYPGTGVGLFLAKRITEKLGGSLRAGSPGPGKGSVFTIILPGTFK